MLLLTTTTSRCERTQATQVFQGLRIDDSGFAKTGYGQRLKQLFHLNLFGSQLSNELEPVSLTECGGYVHHDDAGQLPVCDTGANHATIQFEFDPVSV